MKNNLTIFLVFFSVNSLNLYFGVPRLEKFTAIDEALWSYGRVPKFWKSIAKGNWKGTSLCDKPGVTLAAISGLGLPFTTDPQKFENMRSQAKTPAQLEAINDIYFSLRLPVYLFFLASLPFFYYFIKRLANRKIALLSVIFIGLSPILLGMSLIVNTDAILWILMPFSLFSFLIYQKEDNRKFLYLSGLILGFSILNKYVSNLLYPFFLALIYFKYIFSDHSKEEGIRYFKNSMKDYLVLAAISLATILIFYPNAWVIPITSLLETTLLSMAFEKVWPIFIGILAVILADVFLIKSFFSRAICYLIRRYHSIFVRIISLTAIGLIVFAAINVFSDMKYYDFEEILFMPKPDYEFFAEFKANIFSAFYPLIFGLTPVAAIFFFISAIFLLSANKISKNKNLFFGLSLLFFILVFYMANSSALISSTVRYQIIIYPIAGVIAAIGVWEFFNLNLFRKYFSDTKIYLVFALIIIASIFSLRSIDPHFLSYSSEILPKKYIINPRDMADGSWEASQYLNSLPDAEKMVIWTDKKQVCEKFIGRCFKEVDDVQNYDYYVTSRSEKKEKLGEARVKNTNNYKLGGNFVDLPRMYSENDPGDYLVVIGVRSKNYVKITSADSATIKETK
jgi:hypothetical protein